MQPFDLERFKAGEPAYVAKNDDTEYLYYGDLPDGYIVMKSKSSTKNRVWRVISLSLDYINDYFYMKERELTWEDVYDMWAKTDSRTYSNIYKWLQENFEPPKLKKK
jgi:hypothetical protein